MVANAILRKRSALTLLRNNEHFGEVIYAAGVKAGSSDLGSKRESACPAARNGRDWSRRDLRLSVFKRGQMGNDPRPRQGGVSNVAGADELS